MTASTDDENEAACRRLMKELSPEQKKIAAYAASYRYFVQAELNGTTSTAAEDAANTNNADAAADADADADALDQAASTYVGWFLHAEHGNETKALARMRNAIAWRQEVNMDDMYKVMDPRFNNGNGSMDNAPATLTATDDETKDRRAHLKQGLIDTMENGRLYTAGYDKQGVAYVLFQMHEYFKFDKEFHYKHSFWVVERALAATQRNTDGQKHGMHFIFNYGEYALRNTMPLGMVRHTLYIGLTHYPELIHKIFVVDAPFLFRALWVFIQPFLDASTKSKIQFVKGDEAKREHLLPVFDTDQSAACMLSQEADAAAAAADGDQQGAGRPPLGDPKVYMEETPFDYTFGEKIIVS